MWRPGFEYLTSQLATVDGLHRAPCIYSWVHRGSKERPGIVLGLDKGGSCVGTAFEVDAEKREQVTEYLRARELVTNVYLETKRAVQLEDKRIVHAITYVVDNSHEQYAGQLSEQALIDLISGAAGQSGKNDDYFISSAEHLHNLGIEDPLMNSLAVELKRRKNSK